MSEAPRFPAELHVLCPPGQAPEPRIERDTPKSDTPSFLNSRTAGHARRAVGHAVGVLLFTQDDSRTARAACAILPPQLHPEQAVLQKEAAQGEYLSNTLKLGQSVEVDETSVGKWFVPASSPLHADQIQALQKRGKKFSAYPVHWRVLGMRERRTGKTVVRFLRPLAFRRLLSRAFGLNPPKPIRALNHKTLIWTFFFLLQPQ